MLRPQKPSTGTSDPSLESRPSTRIIQPGSTEIGGQGYSEARSEASWTGGFQFSETRHVLPKTVGFERDKGSCAVFFGVLHLSRALSYIGLDENLPPKLPLKTPQTPPERFTSHRAHERLLPDCPTPLPWLPSSLCRTCRSIYNTGIRQRTFRRSFANSHHTSNRQASRNGKVSKSIDAMTEAEMQPLNPCLKSYNSTRYIFTMLELEAMLTPIGLPETQLQRLADVWHFNASKFEQGGIYYPSSTLPRRDCIRDTFSLWTSHIRQ